MKQFIIGIILGSLVTGAAVQAKDYLNRSPQQQQYDYFRERQMQQDIETMQRSQSNQRIQGMGKSPC